MAAQEDFEMLANLAERFALDEEQAENFITSSMKRLGYRAKAMWEDDDSQGGGNDGGDFFSVSRKSGRQTRPTRGSGRGSGAGWQYKAS